LGVIYFIVDFVSSSKEKIETVLSFVKYIKKLPNYNIINYNIVFPMSDRNIKFYKVRLIQSCLRLSKIFWPIGICLLTIYSSLFNLHNIFLNEWLSIFLLEIFLFNCYFVYNCYKKVTKINLYLS